MKRSKILLVSAAAVLVCCAFAIPAFAEASYQTPAQAAAGVTGMTLEEVQEERAETGKTYGEIAAENDRLAEFQEARQSMREEAADTEPAAVSSTGNGNGACDGSCNSTDICDGSCLGAGTGMVTACVTVPATVPVCATALASVPGTATATVCAMAPATARASVTAPAPGTETAMVYAMAPAVET